MEPRIKKFLEFNGKVINFVAIDGTYWISIKPICDALNIEYTRTFKNISEDEILGQLLAKQPMVGADFRLRKMVALPEKYIYGWLFSIRSGSQLLQEYKRKCYDVLYEYFHGSITQRHQALLNKSEALARLEELEQSLAEIPAFKEYNNTKARIMRIGKDLKALDDNLIHGQLTFNFNQEN